RASPWMPGSAPGMTPGVRTGCINRSFPRKRGSEAAISSFRFLDSRLRGNERRMRRGFGCKVFNCTRGLLTHLLIPVPGSSLWLAEHRLQRESNDQSAKLPLQRLQLRHGGGAQGRAVVAGDDEPETAPGHGQCIFGIAAIDARDFSGLLGRGADP